MKLEAARRLELTEPTESGDQVEGRYSGVKVAVADLQVTLTFEVPVHWVVIRLTIEQINDPDVVFTEDQKFDRKIGVLAEDGYAPTVGEALKPAQIRQHLLDFFHRFPHAELRGPVLTVPHAEGESAAALRDGSRLVNALSAAIREAPRMPLEAPPVLIQRPEDRLSNRLAQMKSALIVVGCLVVCVVAFALLPAVVAATGIAFAGLIAFLMLRDVP